jgi:outer membrane protein assembly factor BamB
LLTDFTEKERTRRIHCCHQSEKNENPRMKAKVLSSILSMVAAGAWAANWPAWRNDGNGMSPEKSAPVKWSATENVRWRTALPDRGNGSPIVWEDKIFITQAAGDRREIMCLDRKNGKILWQSGTSYAGRERTHEDNPYGAATPVTDGERVIAWFGSAGIFCYGMSGKELWRRDVGKQDHEWGYGSSPIIHNDFCLLHFGPGPRNFLVALDKKTGKTAWQVDLPENDPPQRFDGFAGKKSQPMGSWSTPLIVKTGNRDEVVLSIAGEMRGFNPKTGREIWKCDGLNPLIYTSVMAGEGVVVGTGGFFGATVAVKADGAGDISDRKLWSVQREKKNRLSTGVITKGHVFLCNMDGIAQCLELMTGKDKWSERLKPTGASGEIWGSTIMAGDNLYVVNRSGDTLVMKANPEKFELVSTNPLKEMSNSTLAISDGEIFIRTHKALWCISEKNSERAALP